MKITILLATFNGAQHLGAQLASIAAQDGVDWRLWVSDDGSTDGTLSVVTEFARTHQDHEVRLMQGPKAGSAANFLHLLHHPDLPDDPVAFCDQDDVWLPHKLRRASDWIARQQGQALYGSATLVSDAALEKARPSRQRGLPSFPRALVQNIVAGNTMLLNRPAVKALRQMPPACPIAFHDWWVYLVLSGTGADIFVDPEPGLLYRQHSHNELGDAERLVAMARRLRLVRDGAYGQWLRTNTKALLPYAPQLLPEHSVTLHQFAKDLGRPGPSRVRRMIRAGIRRDGGAQTAFLYASALSGRV
ncbi:glycosyltransferase [Falsirhodobacter deserti]|uniref:glycosyltransferase n=1 Tax=Falsirhodobacter deserti TaxID=1365611 RepID=UPI000FE31BF3|nr:glycosyltransferase [Falsirhodobacter deserti]